jgi:hypothetical protein
LQELFTVNFSSFVFIGVLEHENVVIIADKHTMPYLDGRAPNMNRRLPYDALIEENLYDPNIYEYAPVGFKSLVKFLYRFAFIAFGF